MEDDRLNSPSTWAITLEVLGHQLQISQDPNSKHLGTTVWDASMVFIKFLERNSRKGRFSASKLKGKRAVELGAGCGLAGFGMALLGCDVVSTDQVEVLPLLMRNVERNTSCIMQANPDSASFGSITVAELDWGNEDHIKAVEPPFDYIIGTDVVYAEHLLEPLLQTILALSGPKTTVLLGYEIRSTTVHERMMQMWKSNFEVKTVSQAKMDSTYRHPSIQLYVMEQKAPSKCEATVANTLNAENSEKSISNAPEIPTASHGDAEDRVGSVIGEGEATNNESSVDEQLAEDSNVDDWQTRRCGSTAARLLKDVKIV